MLMLNLYYIWSLLLFLMSSLFLGLCLNFMLLDYSLMVEWVILSFNSVSMSYFIYLDWISMGFSFVVFFISSMVVLYSGVYMGTYNYSSVRFLLLVLMFVTSMLLMIVSPSLVSIMLGWDGLGLVSYCLVIYYSSLKSYLAGMITCLINRLGDIGLLISISWLFGYGSWNFMFYLDYYSDFIFYLIIISSFTKSAQIPFSSWLPAAMAAPTPVSALVHSSTLVTAGVYLLIRFYNYFMFTNYFFMFVGIMTMILSSLCANYEFDLKSIIALSTLSQLGLMMSCLFMGLVDLSMFHLLSHAMFKSLLFLCSGIIIHLMGGSQDIRMMGSICVNLPLTCSCFNVANMALCGFPFLSGFYSKDFIIEMGVFNGLNMLYLIMFYLSLGLTSLYSIRLIYYTLLAGYSYNSLINSGLGGTIYHMKYSLILLSFFSVTFGCTFIWLTNLDLGFLILPLTVKILSLAMVSLGVYLGYELSFIISYLMPNKYYFLNGSMWFMYSYSYGFFKANYMYGLSVFNAMYWGEYYGGAGISFYLSKVSNLMQFMFLGSLKGFCLMLIVWLFFLI
uniref:NADH dehydrogenase subunit 5 n=1 Tax=Nesophrosyne sp. 281 GMB-2012 TaxID=2974348 RepID=UPI002182518F|nr:NADH dehydrogenase subunit 5 [Nesophrosyne sp. 281 GMB-2012]UVI59680.1 NADH dehydrogenase subunit 5 [Nesophrosyne sp. 281 GMB-2012]